MTELNRRRPFFRPLSSQSVFTPAANARRTPARWPVGDEPSLEEMFADGHLVRKAITDKHPGWAVMGYCPKEEKHEEV